MALHGACSVCTAPIRQDPSDRSEQVSSLLFGEPFQVHLEKGNWLLIKALQDGYEGWIDRQQILPISLTELAAHTENHEVSNSVGLSVSELKGSSLQITRILPGSILPLFDAGRFQFADTVCRFDGSVIVSHDLFQLHTFSKLFEGAPYLWGGRSPFGIDCSGLMQVLFRLIGITLPRDAHQQAHSGTVVERLEDAEFGDVCFFGSPNISHVGVLMGKGLIFHASGYVRTDRVDEKGIINSVSGKYSHELETIRRMSPLTAMPFLQV